MGYPALQSGLYDEPARHRGVRNDIVCGPARGRIPLRWLLCFGFSMLSLSAFLLSDINLQVSMASVIFPDRAERRGHQFYFRAADHGNH